MKQFLIAFSVAGVLAGSASILSGPAMAHEPGTYESPIVEQRVKRFKQSGADIQAVFKKHIPAKDFAAIEAAAQRMAAWADDMPDSFPPGSKSVGARASLWDDFADFKTKAAAQATAARNLQAAASAGSGDVAQVAAAAKKLGGTCKACHDAYRIKH
jgi:cytochrome c556